MDPGPPCPDPLVPWPDLAGCGLGVGLGHCCPIALAAPEKILVLLTLENRHSSNRKYRHLQTALEYLI